MPPRSQALCPLYENSVASIEQSYRQFGHTLGWRFLMGPKATLSASTEFALISLNPGGSGNPLGHPSASREGGCAYLDETWPGSDPGSAPLQRQVQSLCRMVQQAVGNSESLSEFMNSRLLAGCFVPFRSPNFGALPLRDESVKFARRLWGRILAAWIPKLIITIDQEAFRSFRAILDGQGEARISEHRLWPSGWGDYQCESLRFNDIRAGSSVTLARLPHLSRFALFGRAASEQPMREFIQYLCADLAVRGMAN